MGRKQKERQKKKNQAAAAAAAAAATAAATSTGNTAAGVNTSATAGRSSSVIDIDGDIDIGVAAAKKGTSTTDTTIMARCYHGSTAENVAMGSHFRMAIDEWITTLINSADKNRPEKQIVFTNFQVKHKELLSNPEFFQCIFALGTDMFKTSYGSEENFLSKWKLKSVLNLGIRSYWSSSLSIDNEKYEKYSRDSLTKRGIINILDRETKTFCHCMKPYKEEAKRMEKIGMCRNCRKGFPKLKLKSCSRCLNPHNRHQKERMTKQRLTKKLYIRLFVGTI